MNEIIKTVIPVITAVVSFLLGRYSTTATIKNEVLEKRFRDFYFIYISYIAKHFKLANSVNELLEKQNEFINFLWDNYYLAGNETQKLILDYLSSLLDNDFSEWDSHVDKITSSVFEEYKYICKKLKYPPPQLPCYDSLAERIASLVQSEVEKIV